MCLTTVQNTIEMVVINRCMLRGINTPEQPGVDCSF